MENGVAKSIRLRTPEGLKEITVATVVCNVPIKAAVKSKTKGHVLEEAQLIGTKDWSRSSVRSASERLAVKDPGLRGTTRSAASVALAPSRLQGI